MMTDRESRHANPERLYGRLLRLYPPGFQVLFGSEMVEVFRESYAAAALGGGVEMRFAFWLWAFADLVRSLPGEWGHALRQADALDRFVRSSADAFAVPAWIIAILFMQGYTWAVLAQFLENLIQHVNPAASGAGGAGLLAVAVFATASLALVSGLVAWVIGRSNRIPDSILKL